VKRPQRRRPRLLRFYRQYLLEEDSAGFIRSVAGIYDLPALVRLAERGNRMVRRAAILALGMVADFRANDVLGRALADLDRGVRLLADEALRQIWLRDGNEAQRQKLRIAVQLNQSFDFPAAIELTTQLIREAPALAEACHQRAIAAACLGEFDDAIADCARTLELNPYHFAAAAAMGQAHVELNDRRSALDSFQSALTLNPDLDGVRARVRQLRKQLDET
jgi:tetratricopeptide (TPR) repeat protein